MLNRGEFEILSVLDEPMTISTLAETTGRSESYVSRLVSSLVEKALVVRQRDGRNKLVEPASSEAVRRYQDIARTHPHIEFPELLHGKAVPVLYSLGEPVTVREIAERTDNYRNTVHRIVTRFQGRGIVRKNEGTYVLNDDFQELNGFARALISHLHRIDAPVPGTIIWESVDEFLFQTESEIGEDRYLLTGPHRFTEYELPLVTTDQRYYFYSERATELRAADVVCHMLLIDDSARYKRYCLLLIAKQDVDEAHLRERAEHYGVEEPVDELLRYLETRGEQAPADIAPWNQFEQLAAEYEIEL